MFAVYDGHGGSENCNYLKENLHTYIFTSYNPKDFKKGIEEACKKIDTDFMNLARKEYKCDTSGSCALVLLAIGKLSLNLTFLIL
jgi:serine/threonine protein phosphatase PrpC